MSNNSNLLKSFYNALPPHAEGGTQSDQLYVSRYSDNSDDLVANITTSIEWNNSASGDTFLFSGLRGSGKTTELTKLINCLNESNDTIAFYCDVSAYLNLNEPSLTAPELLLIALAGLAQDVNKRLGKDLLHDSIWNRINRIMKSSVKLTPKIGLAQGAVEAEVDFSLQENPEFKEKLREFTKDSTEFLKEARAFAQEIRTAIKLKTQKEKVVLVIDSLERLNTSNDDQITLFNTWKDIYFTNPDALKLAGFSIIYTAPPYLHAILPNVDAGFTDTFTLPNFKVLQQPPKNGDCPLNQEGVDEMLCIVEKRFALAYTLISKDVLSHLAYLSGGNVRRLFDLIRATAMKAALLKSPLPIMEKENKAVTQGILDVTQGFQFLNAKDRLWLSKIRQKSTIPTDEMQNILEDLPTIMHLFDHGLILNYRNGSFWYQVPPLFQF